MTTEDRFHEIQRRLAPLRADLLNHSIYRQIDSLDALHLFMQHHVFAVWDFMSLLKALQQRLCCVAIPWLPPSDHLAARFVNEIVLGEESDEDGQGGFASHFDLYHRAMRRCGADTCSIDRFLEHVRRGSSVTSALAQAEAPPPVCRFVQHTFEIIESDDLCAIASAFTFGREDLLPDVFRRVVAESIGGLGDFKFYLSRHIELDGEHHGPMSRRLITALCGDDEAKWRVAENAAASSLQARKKLWDGMLLAVQKPVPS